MSDSDSDDTFVVLGTPLRPYDEDEPVKKQFDIQNQKVKDVQGRQRFHGAFTGGFSAGYFNTVGSKEGWTPSTFVSSRGSRAKNVLQRPEDYMDEEDLGEYGIAPRMVKATDEFKSNQQKAGKRPLVSDGLIPGEAPLIEIIKPASVTMGIRLLRKLGWREGQGIGPRIRKKKKKKQSTPSEGQRIYGCTLPDLASHDSNSSGDGDLHTMIPSDVTFAPKDICPIDFKPKDNLYGLGYSGVVIGNEANQFQLFDVTSEVPDSRARKGIHGQAFGVGALEDDDDDIYAPDKLSNYDTILGGADNTGTYGWTAPLNKGGGAPKDYSDIILEGFQLLSARLQPKKVYPPPQLPKNFKPYHVFTEDEKATTRMAQEIPKRFSMSWKKLGAAGRREALGEKPDIKSVFDLVSEKDKQHIKSCQTSDKQPDTGSSKNNDKERETNEQIQKAKDAILAGMSSRFQSAGTEIISPTMSDQKSTSPSDTVKPGQATPLYNESTAFKPFVTDPEKQSRYEKYLVAKKTGNIEGYDVETGHVTEWEKSREKDEFARASQFYHPISSLMASRFTQAQYKDEDQVTVNKEGAGDASDQAKAASMKMYGKLTREVFDWHPDKLLCKRFNVPNPYPESTFVGLPKVKRDKFSIFNFLNIPGDESCRTNNTTSVSQSAESTSDLPEEKGSRKKKLGQQAKPLAILASIDLTQSSAMSEVSQRSDEQDESSKVSDQSKSDEVDIPSSLLPSRPPPDIFKAVFGDSDTEESSSEDDSEDKSVDQEKASALEELASSVLNQAEADVSSLKGPMQRTTSDIEAYDCFGVKLELSMSRTLSPPHSGSTTAEPGSHQVNIEKTVDNTTPDADELCDVYGPPLPPGLPPNKNTDDQTKESLQTTDHFKEYSKKKKHKEKNKHKKKSKHKKHKKKHKKEVIVISTPSGSDADSEESVSSHE